MNQIYDEINRIWPEYHVEEVLGKGAYGCVYKVRRENLGVISYSAVKVIQIPPDDSVTRTLIADGMDEASIKTYYEDLARDFLKENAIMETLKSAPNIVTIEDCKVLQSDDGIGYRIFIRMELLESFEKVQASYAFTEDDIVQLGIDVCNALIVCEQENIIHRDIKPANLFINKYGNYKLGDFGVAKQMSHTHTNMTQIGTQQYMAPELFKDKNFADKRVDIYSLGILLYRLANHNKFPFMKLYPEPFTPSDRDRAFMLRTAGNEVPLPDGVDERLAEIICKACSFDREERYSSAKQLRDELVKWKEHKSFVEIEEAKKKAEVEINPAKEDVKQEQEVPEQILLEPEVESQEEQSELVDNHDDIQQKQESIQNNQDYNSKKPGTVSKDKDKGKLWRILAKITFITYFGDILMCPVILPFWLFICPLSFFNYKAFPSLSVIPRCLFAISSHGLIILTHRLIFRYLVPLGINDGQRIFIVISLLAVFFPMRRIEGFLAKKVGNKSFV